MPQGAPLVEHLLSRLTRDLDEALLQPGAFIGTRRDLCEQYGVTADIFFQAVRILEARGLAEMRPGSGGGLFATGGSLSGCARRLGTYLEFIGVDFDDANPVSVLLQGMCVREAVANTSVEAATAIRATARKLLAATEHFERSRLLARLFDAFADTSGNPVLALFYRVVTSVMLDIVSIDEPDWEGHAPQAVIVDLSIRLADAVIAGDDDGAGSHYLMFRRSLNLRHDLRDRGADIDENEAFDAARGTSRTLSARLARFMLNQIRHRRWPVGQKLGTEPELLARYGVSRATFRQAVRLLEEYSAVEMRRGPKGGLLIASPTASAVNQHAVDLLRTRGATVDQVRAMATQLVGLAFDLAVSRTGDGRKLLRSAAMAGAALAEPSRGIALLKDAILEASGSKTLQLLVQLLDPLWPADAVPAAPHAAATMALLETFGEALRVRDRHQARCAIVELMRNQSAPRG